MWITFVQSIRSVQIPTEWHQTVPSLIITEMWNWDWSGYTTEVPWPGGYMLYKKVGDALFFTLPFTSELLLTETGKV